MVSLFTKVPLEDTLEELLQPLFDPTVVELFQLASTFYIFIYKGEHYEQSNGVALSSPLSPVFANFIWNGLHIRCCRRLPLNPLTCTAMWMTHF